MDCLIWDKINPDEEAFALYAGIKQDAAMAIREIANKSQDMRVIKLAATILGA